MAIDRDRLCKLLGMLGSAHDGEALNAARLVDQMVRESGLGWPSLLAPQAAVEPDEPKLDRLIEAALPADPLRLQLRELRRQLRAGRLSDADRRFIRLLYRKAVLEGTITEPG